MAFEITKLLNSNIETLGGDQNSSSFSFVFIGNIHKERKLVRLLPLSAENHGVVNKAVEMFERKRLACITFEKGEYYFKVHPDLIKSLPEDDFRLECQKTIFQKKIIRKNMQLFPLEIEKYNSLKKTIELWTFAART